MEKVLAVMDESCSRPDFQVDDLCRAMAMSRTAFFNKLKAVTGKAPNDFIRIFRLERAAELLSAHELTITEVADKVGFSDPKYFSSCFRRHFGVSPSKY
jgi:AraC-like DNA-binding protein